MKILFVCSGNHGLSPIVSAQADSLVKAGHEVQIHRIVGKGIWGYLSNVPKLHSVIRRTRFDAIHAHYSFCGIACALATRRPIVCSLMGSDVKSSGLWRMIIRFFAKYIWGSTVVKSTDMMISMKLTSKDVHVIPNGVDLDLFVPMDRNECRAKIGWGNASKIVLFAADPSRMEKNFDLAHNSMLHLGYDDVELKVVFGVEQKEMPQFYNAADVLLLTSKWEGSPNVIKEAMACNTPIVATKVGDIEELFHQTPGYYIASANAKDIALQMRNAFNQCGNSMGRERLNRLGLDSDSIARKLSTIYRTLLQHPHK